MSKLTLILFLSAFVFITHAQKTNFTITEYSTGKGLSQSVVHCVIQDSRGFIWAGTQDGLNRFDGKEFKVYKHNPLDSNSLSNSSVWQIMEDSDSNLWIGTYGGGLNYFDYEKEVFIQYRYSKNQNAINGDDVRAIFEDIDHKIWVGTNNGLNRFDTQTGRWENLSDEENGTVPYKNIRNIYPHNENGLWLAAYGTGLVYFDKKENKSILYSSSDKKSKSLSSNDVWEIYRDRIGTYWVLTFGGGINLFKGIEFDVAEPIEFEKVFYSEIDKDITAIFEKENGDMLIGTDTQGLAIIDSSRKNIEHIYIDPGKTGTPTNIGVWDIVKDNSDNYWLGTFGGGLNKLNFTKSKFDHISRNSQTVQLNYPIVFVIKKITESKFVVGTYGGGLSILDNATGSSKFYTIENSGIASNYITSLVVENDSSYWIGTDGKGLSHFNPVRGSFSSYNTNQFERLPNDFIKCMLIDSYKNIWVGTLKGLCNIQDSAKIKDGFYSNKIFEHDVRVLLELKPGEILIGTHGEGIYKHNINTGSLEKFGNQLIKDKQITGLYLTNNNTLWIGTRGSGLIKYNIDENRAQLFTELDGLCNNTILGVEEDINNRLWITTNNGISVLDMGRSKFINYYSVDGLLSNEFVFGSIYKDDEGIIYAGSVAGIEVIHPERFTVSDFNPPIEITQISVLNEERSIGDIKDGELELSYTENFVKIKFAAIDLTNPLKNLYRYRVFPGSREWINIGTENTVNFANLPPNNYSIELNGSNSDGIWSNNVERLTLVINPPFYNTYWFYTIVIIVVGFVVYRFYYLRIQKRMEMDRLRLKIAKDLHDDVGSSLSQIALNADMINYENDIDKIRRKGEIIRSKSSEMVNLMNDVIWSIDSRKDNLESLVERIKATTTQFTSTKNMNVNFKIALSNSQKKLKVNLRQNVYLIVKEAVNNAVKYSNGDKIYIEIIEKNEALKIEVADNGTGINDDDFNKGNGLGNMGSRADEINGILKFKNNNGFIVSLNVNIN